MKLGTIIGAALLLVLWTGCTYVPVATDYPSYKEGDFVQRLDHDQFIYWISAETKDGYSYHYAFTEHAYWRCKRSDGSHSVACTSLPDGKFIFLYPYWHWNKFSAGALDIVINEEECHVSAIQSGVEDLCHDD